MPKVILGPDENGQDFQLSISQLHKNTLDTAIHMVKNKNFDYIAVVAGLPGSGKSTFARVSAKYCDPTFDLSRVAFTADEFVEITNSCPEYSSIVLDESFQSLNSKTSMSPEFIKIVNHLQLVRQRHLFIYLCLPNFFDLAKGIAIFRTHTLFVVYSDENFNRGKFMAFGRREKTKLYVKGNKFMDYNCVRSNYNTVFSRNRLLFNEDEYEKMKKKHLLAQERDEALKSRSRFDRNAVVYRLKTEFELGYNQLADLFKLKESTLRDIVKDFIEHRIKKPERS
jgi:adenylate kinase family enzyme